MSVAEVQDDEMSSSKNRGGRPRGKFDPNIDWALAESLFVFGQTDERGEVSFPSFKEIGKRAGTSKANVQHRAKRYNWGQLRSDQLANKGLPAAEKKTVPGVGAAVPVLMNPRARGFRTPEEIVLASVRLFDRNLKSGKVRMDTVHDLDKAVRLLAFVRGEADSRKTTHTVISLQVLQQRHRDTREVIDTSGEEVTGVLHAGGEGYSLDGEDEHDPMAGKGPTLLPPSRVGWVAAALRVAASVE